MPPTRRAHPRMNYAENEIVTDFFYNSLFENEYDASNNSSEGSQSTVSSAPTSTAPAMTTPEYVYSDDGNRFIPCPYCYMAYSYKSHLEKHLRACIKRNASFHVEESIKSEETLPLEQVDDDVQIVEEGKVETITIDTSSDEEDAEDIAAENDDDMMQEDQHHDMEGEDDEDNLLVPDESASENKCYYCRSVFPNLSSFLEHHRKHHKGIRTCLTEQQYVAILSFRSYNDLRCPVCPLINSTKINIKRHLMTHLLVKPFKCSYCPERFNREYLKRAHEKGCREY